MIESYELSAKHLESLGWIKENSASFKKDGLEIVFDTSTYVELYDNKKRIAEARIDSVDDMKTFLEQNNLS